MGEWYFEFVGGPLDGQELTLPSRCEAMLFDGHAYEWAWAQSMCDDALGRCIMCYAPKDTERVIYDGVDLTGILKNG